MWIKNTDEVIVDGTGRPIFLPLEEFKDICTSRRCFICGKSRSEIEFNDEHVFPQWMLRDLDLFTETMNLPNRVKVKYGTYKIDCCKLCNSELGRLYEERVSTIIKTYSPDEILSKQNEFLVFRWLALIFLKTHLRDRQNPNELDKTKFSGYISDEYEWSFLHYAHAIVRSELNNVACDDSVFGSFFILPFYDPSASDLFDYADYLYGNSIMIRYKNFCIFAVLDDGGACQKLLSNHLNRITGSINRLQALELLIELAFLRVHLTDYPQFSTITDLENEKSIIIGQRPVEEIVLNELNYDVRARLMKFFYGELVEKLSIDPSLMETGHLTFLFDDDGIFRADSIRLKEDRV